MDTIELQIWKMDEFETTKGAVEFPIDVHDITLRFSARYTGNPAVFQTVLDPTGKVMFRKPLGLFRPPNAPPVALVGEGEVTFGLRINRPGRYTCVAEFNGQRIAQDHFRILQYPSIHRE